MSSARSWRLALAGAVTAIFIWLISREFRGGEILAVVARAAPLWVLLALVCVAAGYLVRIVRWRRLLLPLQPSLKWHECAGPLLAGFAVNNLLPLRAGDVLRAAAFADRLGVSVGGTTISLVIERIFDALMLLIFLMVALWWFDVPQGLRFAPLSPFDLDTEILWWLLPLMPVLGIGLLWLWLRSARLRSEVAAALHALRATWRGRSLIELGGWTLFVWIFEGSAFWCAAMALSALVEPQAAWLAFPVATLATLLPSTPGHVGTFDYFAAEAMQWLGNTVAGSLGFAILIHLLLWLPVTLAGLLWLWMRRT
jgi:uncharacterized membrane protein YbhN (UPF0104 family)